MPARRRSTSYEHGADDVGGRAGAAAPENGQDDDGATRCTAVNGHADGGARCAPAAPENGHADGAARWAPAAANGHFGRPASSSSSSTSDASAPLNWYGRVSKKLRLEKYTPTNTRIKIIITPMFNALGSITRGFIAAERNGVAGFRQLRNWWQKAVQLYIEVHCVTNFSIRVRVTSTAQFL